MKKAIKVKKAQTGERVKGTVVGPTAMTREYSVDTSGYAAGKKKFPASIKTTVGTKNKKETEGEGSVSRGTVKSFLKGKTVTSPDRQKNGGKVKKSK